MENTCPEIEVAPQSQFSCPTKNADGEKKKISLAEVPKGQTTFDVVKEKFSFGLYKKAAQSQIGDSEQRTFDDWVRRNINVRECCKFVKKKENKDDPICKCGNKRSGHIRRTVEMGPEAKWDQLSCTTLLENNAYGEINFTDIDMPTEPQYMRIAVDNGRAETIKKLQRLFTEFWKLEEPNLLISVTGGAKSFNVSQDICGSFQQGLLSAAKSTNAWLITGGQNCGVMKLVGDVIGRSVFTSKISTIGVGNWGKTWRREMLLNKNKKNRHAVDYKLDTPDKGFAALDPHHTHHFLVDDGTTGKDGIEIDFRGELESLICNMFTKDGVPLPMVTIMIEGGMQSLDQAVSTLRKGKILVVLKGSGRASDILCYGLENITTSEREENGEIFTEPTLSDVCKEEMIRLILKDFSKYSAQGIVEKMIDAVMEISTYRENVTVFSIYNPQPLDFYILSSFMKSSAGGATRMRQMRLAVTWGHAQVVRESIFARQNRKFSTEELNSLLLFSIIKQRTEFVKLLIDHGANVKEFATQANLTRLYNELRTSTTAYRLLEVRRGKENFERGVTLSDVGEIINHIMQGSFTSILCDEKYNKTAQGNETFENPFDMMTIYSCFADDQSMALLFWENCKTPIATGLVAQKLFSYFDKMENKWARMDEEMTEKLENAAREFETLSCGLMTVCCNNYDKAEWTNILTARRKDWGDLNVFAIAKITGSRNFISHVGYQSYLTDIWMGGIHASTPTWKVLLCIIPPFPIFLTFTSKSSTEDSSANSRLEEKAGELEEDTQAFITNKKKLELFYKSPVIKFILNTITYLIFLGVFTATLLGYSSGKTFNDIEFAHLYTLVFVISTFPVEFYLILGKHTQSFTKKFAIHFKKLYNLLDFIVVLMFLFAFWIKVKIKLEYPQHCKNWSTEVVKIQDGRSTVRFNHTHFVALDCSANDLIVDGSNTENVPNVCMNLTNELSAACMTRFDLNNFSEYHQYRMVASLCFAFYCFTFMRMFEINSKIGPKLFMIRRMSIDLFFFIFLLLVFTATYCITSEALMYPFNKNTLGDTIFHAGKRAYLNVFGDINIKGFDNNMLEGHCSINSFNDTFNETYLDSEGLQSSENYNIMGCVRNTTVGKINYYFTFFFLCLYLLFVNIMLINLLIAIFSNTYTDSEAKSGIIYKTQRAEVILQFRKRPWLPNPLSLLYFIGLALNKLVNKSLRRDKRKKIDNQEASSNAYRASLIEKECVGIYLRKKKQNEVTPTSLLEELDKKSMELQKKLENLKKQVKKTLGADNNSTLKGNTMSRTFKKCKSLTTFKAMNFGFPKTTKPAKTSGLPKPSSPTKGVSSDKTSSHDVTNKSTNLESVSLVTHPVHKLSRSSPYGGKGDVMRAVVPEDKVSWNILHEWYDPTDFTDDAVADTDTDDVETILFNAVDEIDRISLYKPYIVADGDPMNPVGRTGLKGRGCLRRRGPNKFAVTIITRWSRTESGSAVLFKSKRAVEVLLVQSDTSPLLTLPKIACDAFIDVNSHKKVMKKVCFYDREVTTDNENVKTFIDAAFDGKYTIIYKGYFDDTVNTDNAWVEVHVANVHVEGNFSPLPPTTGIQTEKTVWTKLDKKANLRLNDAWLLKLACNKLHSYNPWSNDILI
ncbi:hypothetical protein ACHWQZ_G018888 [Mnemiopsis leidyi]